MLCTEEEKEEISMKIGQNINNLLLYVKKKPFKIYFNW